MFVTIYSAPNDLLVDFRLSRQTYLILSVNFTPKSSLTNGFYKKIFRTTYKCLVVIVSLMRLTRRGSGVVLLGECRFAYSFYSRYLDGKDSPTI